MTVQELEAMRADLAQAEREYRDAETGVAGPWRDHVLDWGGRWLPFMREHVARAEAELAEEVAA